MPTNVSRPHPALPADRLRVGACIIDVPLREVGAPGRRAQRITPKSMGVLLALVQQPGKVVGRDALLAQVWPDTMPTDDVVTQAVTQLRKAFGEQRGQSRYIETIAKNGYRLLAEVEWLPSPSTDDEAAADTVQAPPPGLPEAPATAPASPAVPAAAPVAEPHVHAAPRPPGMRRYGLILLVCALVLFAIALPVLGWLAREDAAPGGAGAQAGEAIPADVPPATPPRPYELLTSTPGFEINPTLSPDASQVAYLVTMREGDAAGARIMVQTTDQSPPRALTEPPAGAWDTDPAWSPSGREIAFVRRRPEQSCQVMLASLNGSERELAPCDPAHRPGFGWSPDGLSLAFSNPAPGAGPPGLHVFELSSGRWRHIDYGARPQEAVQSPRFSPDGRWIGFIRNAPLGDLWRVPVAGGTPERLTAQRAELRGWDWTPDGKAIVFGRRIDSHTRLYRLDVASRQMQDLGLEDAQWPSIAARAPALAFVQRKPHFGLYRWWRDGHGQPRSERLFASSGRDTLPAVSPDGTQLLFTSDRSGRFGLWWAQLRRPETLRLIEGLHPESRFAPVWSPDGSRALVVGSDAEGRPGVFEIQPEPGLVTRLPLPLPASEVLTAAYLPDADRLLVLVGDGSERQRLLLLGRHAAGWTSLATLPDVSSVQLDAAGHRLLLTRLGEDGLWASDLDLDAGSLRRVEQAYPVQLRHRTWAVNEAGRIYYLQQQGDCASTLRILGSGQSEAPHCLDAERLSSMNGFSAHNGSLYLSTTLEDGADIAFMPLPDPAAKSRDWSKYLF